MNTLVAVFAVPRGASFLYDVTQGSVEIQYAYEMKAAQHGQLLHEKLIREKIGDTYYYCSNPRVQNVYGGLSRATIWPNADVEAYCARGGGRRAVTEYRGKIPERLTAEIAAFQSFRRQSPGVSDHSHTRPGSIYLGYETDRSHVSCKKPSRPSWF